MASKQTKKPATKRASEATDAGETSALVESLRADTAPLADVERAAFESRISDADAEAIGTRTQSADVERNAAAWAKIIKPWIHLAIVRYGIARFRYFLELIAALATAREAHV